MEFRPLSVTVNSAENLKNLRRTGTTKMDVYVVVSLSGDERNKNKQQTPVHKDCGPNPRWDHAFSFTVDEAAARAGRLTLEFEIKDEHTLRGHMDVGRVDVPIKELLEQGGGAGDGEPKVMRYSVRLPKGETEGVLEFSYKFGERFTEATPPEAKIEPVIADPAAGGPPNAAPVNQRPSTVALTDMLMASSIMANVSSVVADARPNEAGYDGEFNDDDM